MLIEKIKNQIGMQLLWLVLVLSALLLTLTTFQVETITLSPFLRSFDLQQLKYWGFLLPILSFLILFFSLFQLSSLLRSYHFTADSRMEMLFLLSPFLIYFPDLFYRLDLVLFIFLLQRSLKLQFDVHTQINIKKEIALMALNMSIASLFFPKALLVALLLYLGILIQRGFYLKEFLIYLILLGLPYYFLFSFIYLFDWPFLYKLDLAFQRPDQFALTLSNLNLLLLSLLSFYLLLRSISINSRAVLRSKAQFRNFYNLTLVAIFVLIFLSHVEGVAILCLPLFAIFAQVYPHLKKKWVYESILILLTVLQITHILSQ